MGRCTTCGRPGYALGLCERHYRQMRRGAPTVRQRPRTEYGQFGDRDAIHDLIDWVMDGYPLTTPAERAAH